MAQHPQQVLLARLNSKNDEFFLPVSLLLRFPPRICFRFRISDFGFYLPRRHFILFAASLIHSFTDSYLHGLLPKDEVKSRHRIGGRNPDFQNSKN